MTGSGGRPGTGRLAFLDWLRGIAAVAMLNGHAFHAFIRSDLRDGGPYVITQFIGGLPPAVFLFLVGVTLAFLMDSSERKGIATGTRILQGLRRAVCTDYRANACPVCFGNPDSPMTKGTTNAIWFLLGIVGVVQAGFIALFFSFWRRARDARKLREQFRLVGGGVQ